MDPRVGLQLNERDALLLLLARTPGRAAEIYEMRAARALCRPAFFCGERGLSTPPLARAALGAYQGPGAHPPP